MNWEKFWKDRGSAISSGIAALIIIVVGIFLFSNGSSKQTEKKPQTSSTKTSTEKKQSSETQPAAKNQTSTKLPTKYTVQRGDYLSAIAKKFYNDGKKWTLLASTNKLANPQLLYVGTVLTIPEAGTVSSASTNKVGAPSTYTVTKGDNLWDLANRFYNNGYEWYRIRDANLDKVTKLANGRPLILPGSTLKIPK